METGAQRREMIFPELTESVSKPKPEPAAQATALAAFSRAHTNLVRQLPTLILPSDLKNF